MARRPTLEEADTLWQHHGTKLRDPAEIVGGVGGDIDPRLLESRVKGPFWDLLQECQATVFLTREYEHFVLALAGEAGRPGGAESVTYLQCPHPSGLVADRKHRRLYLARTRNPNVVSEFRPLAGFLPRLDKPAPENPGRPLLPARSWSYPGCLYLHDLELIGGRLHANSVGQNAVVRLDEDGTFKRAWWPKCIERPARRRGSPPVPEFGQNYLQLNSIAAGPTIEASFFSASCAELGEIRPGHPEFLVDKRGVIFSGRTREVMCEGLTRPHSARLHQGRVWVDNSGYGEVGYASRDGHFQPVAKLPGWTRGLGFVKHFLLVGTSRVIPKFRQYAPGLDVDRSVCGVHILDAVSGTTLASLVWPWGNQIFAIDWMPSRVTSGFPFLPGIHGQTRLDRTTDLFYSAIF